MKAKLAKAPSFGHWIYEIKFDGWHFLLMTAECDKSGSFPIVIDRDRSDRPSLNFRLIRTA